MPDDASLVDDGWRADFEAASQRTLEASLAATPSQRLAWLEEALEFAHRVGALKERAFEDWPDQSSSG